MLNTSFPSGSLEFWIVLNRDCQCDRPPIKILDTDSLMSFLVENIPYIYHLPQFHVRGIGHILGDYMRRSLWKLGPAFPQTLPRVLFPFFGCNILQL